MTNRDVLPCVLLLLVGCSGSSAAPDAPADAWGADDSLDGGLDGAVSTDASGRPDDADVAIRHDASEGAPADAFGRDSGPVTCAAGTSWEAYMEAATEIDCRTALECTGGRVVRGEAAYCRVDASGRDALLDGLAAGRLVFDGAAACACLAVHEAGCDPGVASVLEQCMAILTHTDAERLCASSGDCAFGACEFFGDSCPGRCARAAEARLGEPCGEGCGAGLRCGAGDMCVRTALIGDPCGSFSDCLFAGRGAWCDIPTGASGGVCRMGRALGESCGVLPTGSPIRCAPRLSCIDGLCGEGGAEGDPCSAARPCGARSWCDTGVCVPSRVPGETCSAESDCPEGFGCAGTCVALPSVGQPCLDGRCWIGRCSGGTCVAASDGAPCDPTLSPRLPQCVGRCDFGTRACSPRLPLGASCASAGDCVDGARCAAGTCVAACVL